jgi:hypothetical protein
MILFVFNYVILHCCIMLLNYLVEIMLLKLLCLIYVTDVVVELYNGSFFYFVSSKHSWNYII